MNNDLRNTLYKSYSTPNISLCENVKKKLKQDNCIVNIMVAGGKNGRNLEHLPL